MNATITKPFQEPPSSNPGPGFGFFLLLLFGIGFILLIVAQWKDVDFIEEDSEGNPMLSEERQRKLDDALRELDEAEQYVLVAVRDGLYPCYNCPNETKIFLYKGETWKYGTTTKGEKGRYGNSLENNNLAYRVQFQGTLHECLKEEKRKIFNYAVLPENLKREPPLIRPPGNKVDR